MTVNLAAADALQLEGIHKTFGNFRRARSRSTSRSRRGELVCFVGPSGCGKTTLLRIIAGLETQTRGRVIQDGRDVSSAPPAARDYGIVFQSYALFPNLTIFDNVAYGLVNRRRGRAEIAARVAELLTLVGLPDSGASIRRSSPAASSSASRWRARWRPRRLAAARRAAVGARRQGARTAARRDPAAAAPPRRDDDHGDARPGRGAVDGRPRRRDEPGHDRAGRRAAGGLRAPGHAVRRRLPRQGQRAGRDLPGRRALSRRPGRTGHAANGVARGQPARLYLRPEDRVLEDSGPLAGLPNCLSRHRAARSTSSAPTACATIEVDGFDGQTMLVYFRSTRHWNSTSAKARELAVRAARRARPRAFRRRSAHERTRSRRAVRLARRRSSCDRGAGRPRRRAGCWCVGLLVFLTLPLATPAGAKLRGPRRARSSAWPTSRSTSQTPALAHSTGNTLTFAGADHAAHGAAGFRVRLRDPAQLHPGQGAVAQHRDDPDPGAVAAGGAVVHLPVRQPGLRSSSCFDWFGLTTIYGLPGMVLAMSFASFPHAVMILLAGLALSDARLYEAAESLGTPGVAQVPDHHAARRALRTDLGGAWSCSRWRCPNSACPR